ncbi:tetratricopeptide repeat protein [Candidatus Neptunochlamydia vexilliferae]|nr:tetratricopeptide repeat protein [Candidatus Neptunochlamydia vexilliferae]
MQPTASSSSSSISQLASNPLPNGYTLEFRNQGGKIVAGLRHQNLTSNSLPLEGSSNKRWAYNALPSSTQKKIGEFIKENKILLNPTDISIGTATFRDFVLPGNTTKLGPINLDGAQIVFQNIGPLSINQFPQGKYSSAYSFPKSKVVHLPGPLKNFTGREAILKQLHLTCQSHSKVMLSGLGGLGKTAIALKYAHLYQGTYQFIHFIDGADPDLIMKGLLHLAEYFGLKHGAPDSRIRLLESRLRESEKPFLLIFDGTDSMKRIDLINSLLPVRKQCILVTSRLSNLDAEYGFESIPLAPFLQSEAIQYLKLKIGEKDEAQATLLAEKLGHLPLALNHAATYIIKNKRWVSNSKAYIELFNKEGLNLYTPKNLRLPANTKTVLTTWSISLKAVSKQSKESVQVADFLSCLEHVPIPLLFLEKWFQSHVSNSGLAFQRGIGYLEDYSLIDTTEGECKMHMLVQESIYFNLAKQISQKLILQALETFYLIVSKKSNKEIINEDYFLAHMKKTIRRYKELFKSSSPFPKKRFVLLLNHLLLSYLSTRNVRQLLPTINLILGEIGTDFSVKSGPENMLYNVARGYGIADQHQEALKYYKRHLSTLEPKDKQTEIASCYDSIGFTLRELGNYQQGLEYHKKALILKQNQKNNGLAIARSYSNIGSTLEFLGKYHEAKSKHQEALDLWIKLNASTAIARGHYNMGTNQITQGEFVRAKDSYNKALGIWQTSLVEDHPFIATAYSGLGSALVAQENYPSGLKFHQKALAIWEKTLGKNHRHIGFCLNNIGEVQRDLKDYQTSLSTLEKALQLRKTILKPSHPAIGETLLNKGLTHYALKEKDQAKICFEEALEIFKNANLETKHPVVDFCIRCKDGEINAKEYKKLFSFF